jgi:hypothetical protein
MRSYSAGGLIGGRLPWLIIESVEEFPEGGLIWPGTRVVLAENPLPAHFLLSNLLSISSAC